jgi:CMP-N,N'-diacetyllegionaminic acid synthase
MLVLAETTDESMGYSVLGIVPARAGSKGITGKNLRLLAGRPLLAYTAQAAIESRLLSKVVLSSEDTEILRVGRLLGLETPFVRPPELAADDTPMIEVVLDCVRWFQSRGEVFDAVCLLQPTSPLRSADSIDRCISALTERDADGVVSIRPVPHEYNPHWVYFEKSDGSLALSTGEADPVPSRQQLPRAYHRDGSVFVAKSRTVLERKSLYGARTVGVLSPESEACDLDTEEQWTALEQRMSFVRRPSFAKDISES